jgi:hypothetical protein
MTANYVLLEKVTVGAANAASVIFNNIPQTGYTDLVVKMSTRSAAAVSGSALAMGMKINGVVTNRTYRRLEAYDGTNTVSDNGSSDMSAVIQGNSTTASIYNNVEVYFPNYTSNKNKSFSVEGANENNSTTGNDIYFFSGLWSQTAAITSLEFYDKGGASVFLANTTFYLYGVAAFNITPAIAPYATGGSTVMTDGTYWYHTFISSGTFTPTKNLTCDYLVVAGGGSGGRSSAGGYSGGGGGAGGLRSTVTATGGGGTLETPLSLVAQAYTVTIGAGGASASINDTQGNSGSDSVFATITSKGGGYGGGQGGLTTGGTGGSGGGGGGSGPGTGAGARTSSPIQGYAGGNGSAGYNGGGGGGAGAVGGNGGNVSLPGGNGGNGVATSISGSSVTYAGGGGGSGYNSPSSGGSGGGGNGSYGGGGAGVTSATANTGSGGGGSSANSSGSGGSGIVIVRYPV